MPTEFRKIKWFPVWKVRNYYTTLEQRAKAGAQLTFGYAMMTVVSAALATGGLLINNPAVVIGSMMVAPFLGPSRAVTLGGIFGNRNLFFGGIIKQLFGLLIIGAGTSYIITILLLWGVLGINVTPEILIRSMNSYKDLILSIIIAISAGAAASLSLITDPSVLDTPWGQVIDAAIGVEVAISLIPPAAVIGIGAAFGSLEISSKAFALLMVNFLGLNILGSMLMFAFFGIKSQYLELEKNIRKTVLFQLKENMHLPLKKDNIDITLLSPKTAKIHVIIRSSEQKLPDSMAKTLAYEIKDKTDCACRVTIEMIPIQKYSML